MQLKLSAKEFVDRAREFAPILRERSRATEELRRLTDETVRDFHEAGFFRALQPERYGGLELDPADFYDAVIEIGAGDASTSWCLSVIGVHSWQLALFDSRAQDEVWGEDPLTLISSSYAATGKVEVVEGGFRLRGRWSFSSGSEHCGWVFLGGVVPRQGDNVDPDALPDIRTFLLPRSDYVIDDVWHVAGLAGSGSQDIVVNDAFVPEYRTLSFLNVLDGTSPGLAVSKAPLFRLPFGSLFVYAVAMPVVGVAYGALQFCTQLTRTRISNYDRSKAAEDPFGQVRLAEAAAAIDAARLQMRSNFEGMMSSARAGVDIPIKHRARYRWDATHAFDQGLRSVDMLFEVSGSRAIFLDNPMQRAFRDAHAMRAHAVNNREKAAQIYARSELGFPNREFLI